MIKRNGTISNFEEAIDQLAKVTIPPDIYVFYKTPYKEILALLGEFGGMSRSQLKRIFVQKKTPDSIFRVFQSVDKKIRENYEKRLQKMIDRKKISLGSIKTSSDLDFYLRKLRELNVVWIDITNTKKTKGVYKIKTDFYGEVIRQQNMFAFDNLFFRDEIIDVDEIIDFPNSFQISNVFWDGDSTFRKINHIMYGINRNDINDDDNNKILKEHLKECLITIEEKIKEIEETVLLEILGRKMIKVINNLGEKTRSKKIRDLLKDKEMELLDAKEDNPSVIFVRELFSKITHLVQTYNGIKSGNKSYRRNYGNDTEKWLKNEIMLWNNSGFSIGGVSVGEIEIIDILNWVRENYKYFLQLHTIGINIGFSRYRTLDISFDDS